MSNLKQNYVQFAQYAVDFNDYLPEAPAGSYGHQQFWNWIEFAFFLKNYGGMSYDPDASNDYTLSAKKHIYACTTVSMRQPDKAGYVYAIGPHDTTKSNNIRITAVGTPGPKGPKALVFCPVSLQPGWTPAYDMAAHNREGGNVLAGDGSAKWESISCFPLSTCWSGEGLNPPTLKYYAYMTDRNYVEPGNHWRDWSTRGLYQ